MKTAKMFLVALAALSMAACSNNDEIPGVENDGTMSMYLKFEGLSTGTTTRATGAAETAGAISFDNITVYFADGSGVIQKTETLNDEADDWTMIGTTGHIFHKIPNSVNQVYVVGNAEGKSLPTVTPKTTNISQVKSAALKVAGEQDFDNVILFGEDTQITPVADGSHEVGEETHEYLYEAEVNLAPFVSRFEVKGIQCENLSNSKYKKIVLEAIGLMDYNNQFTLGGGKSEEMTITNVLEPGSTAEEGKYIFGETSDTSNGEYTNYSWAWDKITGATLTGSETVYNPTAGYYIYQFCPLQITGGKNVQIKLAVDAYTDDSTIDPMGAVVTARFQKQGTSGLEDLTSFEAGKIYRIDNYKFKVENVKPWNPDEEICVNVVVKVQEWEVVPLTPVFE